jgi:hypothetical protein
MCKLEGYANIVGTCCANFVFEVLPVPLITPRARALRCCPNQLDVFVTPFDPVPAPCTAARPCLNSATAAAYPASHPGLAFDCGCGCAAAARSGFGSPRTSSGRNNLIDEPGRGELQNAVAGSQLPVFTPSGFVNQIISAGACPRTAEP